MAAETNCQSEFNFERPKFQDPTWMLRNAGKCIRTIAPWEVNICETAVESDVEVEVLCTYSWNLRGTKDINAIVFAPGFPHRWNPPEVPTQLRYGGLSFMDAHAYWAATFQFEPTFQAMKAMNPKARFDDVDIVINRNSLINLFRFVLGNRTDPFNIDMHIIGKTLLLGRKEKVVIGNSFGYGQSFEEIFTEGLNEDADTYHRVINYKFGNLNLVVRHEVDAFCESIYEESEAKFAETFRGSTSFDEHKAPIQIPILGHPLATAVLPSGIHVRQRQVAELKTSGRDKGIRQCWFGRTPNLCVAKHKGGLVQNADMRIVWHDCVEWERRHQETLRRLAGLLGQLRETMMHSQIDRAVLVRMEKVAPLQIYEGKQDMNDALPWQVKAQFWKQEETQDLAEKMGVNS